MLGELKVRVIWGIAMNRLATRLRDRRVIVGGILLVLSGILFALWATRPPVGYYSMKRVKKGMTRAEVEAVVGGGPGWYGNPSGIHHGIPTDDEHMGFERYRQWNYDGPWKYACDCRWYTDEYMLCVTFEEDAATSVQVVDQDPNCQRSTLDRLRSILGL
jgi:hypothetical protein